ncbi:hypothetical protein LJC30_00900 [Odoribacter sp. OttesenSCG-928-L07]|nr:hypothetical protein [Odoribacter sp. OttesenSCG-928-L07]MDL2238975.1 hypothetical protein [Bacteroidales bacterium OttesenSCG-928-L14]MDL2240872.1 hypothetical protein [Bacteroidales bacterium OttesenSCG-928-K22]
MKKIILLFALPAIIFAGCVKQKNCEGCITGKWVYFEEPICPDYIAPSYCNKINAMFYVDTSSTPLYFIEPIPKAFKSSDTITVCLSFKFIPNLIYNYDILPFKLVCIEKID